MRRRYINVIPAIQDDNFTRAFAHAHRSDNYTVTAVQLRHEPVLSMFLMPFPMLCSVVAVISCSRNRHVLDVAAAVFLAHSAKPFSIDADVVSQTQSQDRQHIASILGGLSMGIAACMCICLACYRMTELAAATTREEEEDPIRKTRRSRRMAALL